MCRICGEPKEAHKRKQKHVGTEKVLSSFPVYEVKPLVSVGSLQDFNESEDERVCEVCCETVSQAQLVSLACGHGFCKKCTKEYLTVAIKSGQVEKFRCMKHMCKETFTS